MVRFKASVRFLHWMECPESLQIQKYTVYVLKMTNLHAAEVIWVWCHADTLIIFPLCPPSDRITHTRTCFSTIQDQDECLLLGGTPARSIAHGKALLYKLGHSIDCFTIFRRNNLISSNPVFHTILTFWVDIWAKYCLKRREQWRL